MATVTSSGGKKVDVLSGNLVIDKSNNRMLLDNTTEYRMMIGVLPDGDIGIVITKDGTDVFDVFN